MKLSDASMSGWLGRLQTANAEVAGRYPIESGARQPVHTVYGGAHLFAADLAPKLGALALRALDEYATDAEEFASAAGFTADMALARVIHARVRDKLGREPVEDFRIDFEDGYGNRTDDEEDGHAWLAARETAAGLNSGTLPPFCGIRIKPLSDELGRRSLRTLDLYLGALLEASGGALPPGFVVTLPKITTPVHVEVAAAALAELEQVHDLTTGALRLELMIETTQSIFDGDGRSSLPQLIAAGGGRIVAAHFGTYDYTAS